MLASWGKLPFGFIPKPVIKRLFISKKEGEMMNEIEKKYFNAFKKFVKVSPKMTFINNTKQCSNEVSVLYNERENEDDDTIEFYSDRSLYFHISLFLTQEKMVKNTEIYLTSDPTPVEGYIPDFYILPYSVLAKTQFAVEIDGHEWHEKTKEQAANDKRKDRIYLKNNTIPIRFTGSEVFHDPFACVRETLEIIARYLETEEDVYSRGRVDYQYGMNMGAIPLEDQAEKKLLKNA